MALHFWTKLSTCCRRPAWQSDSESDSVGEEPSLACRSLSYRASRSLPNAMDSSFKQQSAATSRTLSIRPRPIPSKAFTKSGRPCLFRCESHADRPSQQSGSIRAAARRARVSNFNRAVWSGKSGNDISHDSRCVGVGKSSHWKLNLPPSSMDRNCSSRWFQNLYARIIHHHQCNSRPGV